MAKASCRSRRFAIAPYQTIGTNSAASAAAEIAPSRTRSPSMIEACDCTCGITGFCLGSAPRNADFACGGDMVAAANIAFIASTVP